MISYINLMLVVMLFASLLFLFLYTCHLLYVVITKHHRVKTHQEAIISGLSGKIATVTTTTAVIFAALVVIQYTLWTTIQ